MKLGLFICGFMWLSVSQALAAPILPSVISEVHSYDCKFRFFEGEGVNSDSITCLSGQHLGLYEANYKFYLYQHKNGSNFSLRGTSQQFSSPVCGLRIERFICDQAQETKIEFGLSARSEGIFNVAVSLVPAPHLGGHITGFAAMLGSRGECPDGLVKIRPYYAYPASMLDPLPSNFINRNGSLNSIQVATEKPEAFSLIRTPAVTPCDARGRCQLPDGEPHVASSATYVGASPIVCAVPASAIPQ
jgi:hypothetical protein